MSINITACETAINKVKSNLNTCFTKCNAKGSTYAQTSNTSSELIKKIDAIPTSGGSGGVVSDNITGGAFSGFGVTWSQEIEGDDGLIIPQEFTIDFGSVGVTFKSLICYSSTKLGYFSIMKMTNNLCVISAQTVYACQNDDGFATNLQSCGTYRASYVISGNTIKFTRSDFNISSGDSPGDEFRGLPSQINNSVDWTGQLPETGVSYILDTITVCA